MSTPQSFNIYSYQNNEQTLLGKQAMFKTWLKEVEEEQRRRSYPPPSKYYYENRNFEGNDNLKEMKADFDIVNNFENEENVNFSISSLKKEKSTNQTQFYLEQPPPPINLLQTPKSSLVSSSTCLSSPSNHLKNEQGKWQQQKKQKQQKFSSSADNSPSPSQVSTCPLTENKRKKLVDLRWIDQPTARKSMMIALSFFYAMLATIFALVFELSHIISGDTKNRRNMGIKELIFGLYMYGSSIIFLIYCYFALLLHPKWKRKIGALVVHFRSESSQSIVQQAQERKVSHSSPSAGSLFLRLGCVVFGVIGTVYYSFNVFLCISDTTCQQNYLIWLDLLSIIFVFTQMHFVFCNWKLTISQYQTICRFGTMHLVATNLWIWIRYILIEESLMGDEIRQVFARNIGVNNKNDDWGSDEELNENNLNNLTNNLIKNNFSSLL
ncbi:hypothetical protein ACQ4LE_005589, partial [Meloidogyne hapla]